VSACDPVIHAILANEEMMSEYEFYLARYIKEKEVDRDKKEKRIIRMIFVKVPLFV